MDPVGIVGIVASSVTLAARAVTTAKELEEFIRSYRAADKSVARLANQLRVFAGTVDELDNLLDGDAIVSQHLRDCIGSSLQDCDDVLQELENDIKHVVSRKKDARGRPLAFTSKMRLLWSQGSVNKEADRLQMQLQTLLLLTSCVRQKDQRKQNSALSLPSHKKTLAKSARDARSIREGKDSRSVASGGSNWSTDSDTDVMLSIDEEILKSGPYVANYRDMFMKAMRNESSSSTEPQASALAQARPQIQAQAQAQFQPQTAAPKDQPPRQVWDQTQIVARQGPTRQSRELERGRTQESTQLPLLLFPGEQREEANADSNSTPVQFAERPQLVFALDSEPIKKGSSSLEANELAWATANTVAYPYTYPNAVELSGDSAVAKLALPIRRPRNMYRPKTTADELWYEWHVHRALPETGPHLEDAYLKGLLKSAFPEGVFKLPQLAQSWKEEAIKITHARRKEIVSEPKESEDEGLKDLCQACEDGNLKWARYLIDQQDVSPDDLGKIGQGFNGKSPLHIAVDEDRQDMVEFLLDVGTPPDTLDSEYCTPLLYAVERVLNNDVSVDISRLLLEKGADIGVLYKPAFRGQSPLAVAVLRGHFALVELLLKFKPRGHHIEALEKTLTLLIKAVPGGRADLVELLLQHGCFTAEADAKGRVPLVLAIMSGRRDLVYTLMKHKAYMGYPKGLNALNVAVHRVLDTGQDLDMVEAMMDGHLSGHAPDGCPLIHMAIAAKHLALVRLLSKNHQMWLDRDAMHVQWGKQSALGLAVSRGDCQLASILVHLAGVAIDDIDDNGVSPLLLAVRLGNPDMVAMLLDTGKQPQDYHGNCDHGVLGTACCLYRASHLKGGSKKGGIRRLINWGLPVDGISRSWLEFQGRFGVVDDSACRADFYDIGIKDYTALHIAARRSSEATESLLLSGASVSSMAECTLKDTSGDTIPVSKVTPLHLARGTSAWHLLAEPQSNVFAKDSRGRTPLFWAATEIIRTGANQNENLWAVKLNLKHGSPVNLRDMDGCTPLGAVALKMSAWVRTEVCWLSDEQAKAEGRPYVHGDPTPFLEWGAIVQVLVGARAKDDVPLHNKTDVTIGAMLEELEENRVLQDLLRGAKS